jgi:ATP phosphoribosyltransferase
MSDSLLIGLPKGRLFGRAQDLLSRAGIVIDHDLEISRRLKFPDRDRRFDFVALKPVDIPVYVEAGALDAGIVGSDILRELGSDVYEPLDLRIGMCRLVVAGPEKWSGNNGYLRVATKYPRTAEQHFRARNAHVRIVRLDGSVEIAPLMGLSDVIVDLVETGATLRENGLQILEEVAKVSAKLIVNRTSMKLKSAPLNALLAQLDAVVYENL